MKLIKYLPYWLILTISVLLTVFNSETYAQDVLKRNNQQTPLKSGTSNKRAKATSNPKKSIGSSKVNTPTSNNRVSGNRLAQSNMVMTFNGSSLPVYENVKVGDFFLFYEIPEGSVIEDKNNIPYWLKVNILNGSEVSSLTINGEVNKGATRQHTIRLRNGTSTNFISVKQEGWSTEYSEMVREISGRVTDNRGFGIPYATFVIIKGEDDIEELSISTYDGTFNYLIPKYESFLIGVYAMGYEPEVFQPDDSQWYYHIKLKNE